MKKILFITLVLFVSCRQEEIEIQDIGRKIVINAMISSDSLLKVNITRSIFIADTGYFEENILNDANVYIYENNLCIDTLPNSPIQHLNLGMFIEVPSNYISKKTYPLPGHEYTIVVKSEGLPDATAQTIIPNPVLITKLDTSLITLQGEIQSYESNIRIICDIEFEDPSVENNYYLLSVYRTPSAFVESNILQFTCEDPIVEEFLNHGSILEGVAFSDKTINGKKYSLRITLGGKEIGNPFWNDEGFGNISHKKTVYFKLYSITEDYYKYIQSLNLFIENYNNPLTEPTQVHSNILGGYGIFGGSAVSTDSLVFIY